MTLLLVPCTKSYFIGGTIICCFCCELFSLLSKLEVGIDADRDIVEELILAVGWLGVSFVEFYKLFSIFCKVIVKSKYFRYEKKNEKMKNEEERKNEYNENKKKLYIISINNANNISNQRTADK